MSSDTNVTIWLWQDLSCSDVAYTACVVLWVTEQLFLLGPCNQLSPWIVVWLYGMCVFSTSLMSCVCGMRFVTSKILSLLQLPWHTQQRRIQLVILLKCQCLCKYRLHWVATGTYAEADDTFLKIAWTCLSLADSLFWTYFVFDLSPSYKGQDQVTVCCIL